MKVKPDNNAIASALRIGQSTLNNKLSPIASQVEAERPEFGPMLAGDHIPAARKARRGGRDQRTPSIQVSPTARSPSIQVSPTARSPRKTWMWSQLWLMILHRRLSTLGFLFPCSISQCTHRISRGPGTGGKRYANASMKYKRLDSISVHNYNNLLSSLCTERR